MTKGCFFHHFAIKIPVCLYCVYISYPEFNTANTEMKEDLAMSRIMKWSLNNIISLHTAGKRRRKQKGTILGESQTGFIQ
jgi:hypothetical protein